MIKIALFELFQFFKNQNRATDSVFLCVSTQNRNYSMSIARLLLP